MKTLIVEKIDQNRLGELVTVSRLFCEKPDLVALGEGAVPAGFGKAFQADNRIGANLVSPLAELIRQEAYEMILLSASTEGNGVASCLAAILSAPIVSEVTGISNDQVIEKPIYGGKALARYKINKTPSVLTIRRKYFEKAVLDGTMASTPLNISTRPVTLIDEIEQKTEGVPLEDAEFIATGGRGMGSADNFAMLKEMIDLLKGAVGASRGAVDEGWMPPQLQIGQTGKIVAPTVYFAVGVSGASQHLAGISNAKCVVAINKDEEANIFNRARFGIVEDYKKVIPAIIKVLKAEG
ncbi:Electron transfer flavoprotein subunit alpha [uncultured Desulfobacterium sp.]|uniref:Electron transfer flavoprotein subunit alpha n=1 Tax=uncultured Desulfobacterium sp. TaxID=201089 RepID=A0A445MWR5_9BACT|nr:Electron transfer flavoprotein subunit alpha [uncultured Desulfobacterium sp.]